MRIVPSIRPYVRDVFAAPECYDTVALGYTNQTRIDNNTLIRRVRGLKETPQVGDIIICLKNTYFDSGGMIANGSRGLVMSVKPAEPPSAMMKIAFVNDDTIFEGLVNTAQFNRRDLFTLDSLTADFPDRRFRNVDAAGLLCDFGYALTTHKGQGGQWGTVLVDGSVPQQVDEDTRRRWIYTSVSRSSDRLIISGVA